MRRRALWSDVYMRAHTGGYVVVVCCAPAAVQGYLMALPDAAMLMLSAVLGSALLRRGHAVTRQGAKKQSGAVRR
jgi:hypothetical protein